MNKKQKIKLIKDLVEHYKELNENANQINKLFGLDYDSKFFSALWKAFGSYTELVQKSVGDHFDWIPWFIYDNKCGKANMTYLVSGNKKKVNTIEKLVEVIEES